MKTQPKNSIVKFGAVIAKLSGCGLFIIYLCGVACNKGPTFGHHGVPWTPPPTPWPVHYAQASVAGNKGAGSCQWTFTATTASMTINELNKAGGTSIGTITIPTTYTVNITSASVSYTYNCGIPLTATINSVGGGGSTTYTLVFPVNCTGYPSYDSSGVNYETYDKDLLQNLTCSTSGVSWLTAVTTYGGLHSANWPTWCVFDTDDQIPYQISPFAAHKGTASSVLYGSTDWTYEIGSRIWDQTFVSWDKTTDPPTPRYSSLCYDITTCQSGSCADITQINLLVNFEYYEDGGDHF